MPQLTNTTRVLRRVPLAFELQAAALAAQTLLLAAQAIESRVSTLCAETPDSAVVETAHLVKASAAQMALMLHDLVARSERISLHASALPIDPEALGEPVGDVQR